MKTGTCPFIPTNFCVLGSTVDFRPPLERSGLAGGDRSTASVGDRRFVQTAGSKLFSTRIAQKTTASRKQNRSGKPGGAPGETPGRQKYDELISPSGANDYGLFR